MLWKNKNNNKGFTFIEMLIVVSLIVILTATMIFVVSPGEHLMKARDDQREVHLNVIHHAIERKIFFEGEWSCSDAGPLPGDPTIISSEEGDYDLYSCLIPDYLAAPLFDPATGEYINENNYNTGYEIWRNINTQRVSLRVQGETRTIYIGEL